jgi:hypothetical protein
MFTIWRNVAFHNIFVFPIHRYLVHFAEKHSKDSIELASGIESALQSSQFEELEALIILI